MTKEACLSTSWKNEKWGKQDDPRMTLGSEKFSKRIAAGEGGNWYGSGGTQPSHSSERSESQKFQGNSMRNRNPFSMASYFDMHENFSSFEFKTILCLCYNFFSMCFSFFFFFFFLLEGIFPEIDFIASKCNFFFL